MQVCIFIRQMEWHISFLFAATKLMLTQHLFGNINI